MRSATSSDGDDTRLLIAHRGKAPYPVKDGGLIVAGSDALRAEDDGSGQQRRRVVRGSDSQSVGARDEVPGGIEEDIGATARAECSCRVRGEFGYGFIECVVRLGDVQHVGRIRL